MNACLLISRTKEISRKACEIVVKSGSASWRVVPTPQRGDDIHSRPGMAANWAIGGQSGDPAPLNIKLRGFLFEFLPM